LGGGREQLGFPQGAGASVLAVELRMGPVASSVHPRPGRGLLSRPTSSAPAKPQVRGCLSLQTAVCWGHGDVREVRGAAGGGRAWQDAAVLLSALSGGCSPRTSPPAA